jgi:hypothetical protein
MFINNFFFKLKLFANSRLGIFYNKSYSQEGEDMILNRIFVNINNGFYIDVGAHHPKRFSNTYFFYKKGWRGINIDAMTGSMKLFDKFRPRDINIEKPISDKKEVLEFFVFNEPALNTFSKDLYEKRILNKSYFLKYSEMKTTTTLTKILDEYLIESSSIDFLSIDVEGYDLKTLKSLDLKKYRPKVILVEILGCSLEEIFNSDISIFLIENKYSFHAKTGKTFFFVSSEQSNMTNE